MDDLQQEALVGLNRAFARCAKARLRFCGMDQELLAYEGAEFDRLRAGLLAKDSAYEIQQAMGGGMKVDTHGCYVDSGGW